MTGSGARPAFLEGEVLCFEDTEGVPCGDNPVNDYNGFHEVCSYMNYVYLLKCSDDTLYCGWTTDLKKRAAAHNSGRGAKYTRSRLPAELVYFEEYKDRHEALSREWHIKRMSRTDKEKLIASFHMAE